MSFRGGGGSSAPPPALLVLLLAPVVEETMFRGMLFHYLRSRFGRVASVLVVALLFALVHRQGWVSIPMIGAVGLVFAALREWRGSLIASVVAHVINNLVWTLLIRT
jgi:membrane protease YdiL (CAAX protease family)